MKKAELQAELTTRGIYAPKELLVTELRALLSVERKKEKPEKLRLPRKKDELKAALDEAGVAYTSNTTVGEMQLRLRESHRMSTVPKGDDVMPWGKRVGTSYRTIRDLSLIPL